MAEGVKSTADEQLGLRVHATYAAHQLAASLRCQDIDHALSSMLHTAIYRVTRSRKPRGDRTMTGPYRGSVKSRLLPVTTTAAAAVAVAR